MQIMIFRSQVFGLIALLFLASFFVYQIFYFPPLFNGVDFPSWKYDWQNFVCAIGNNVNCSAQSKFPVAYLINSFLSMGLGGETNSEIVLLLTNLAFIGLSIIFIYNQGGSYARTKLVFVYGMSLILSATPAFYVNTGGLELQSGILLGIYSVALLNLVNLSSKKINYLYIYLLASSFLLPLYKDTNVLLMGVALFSIFSMNFFNKQNNNCSFVRLLLINKIPFFVVAAGILPALFLVIYYNLFRYDSLLPEVYLIEGREAAQVIWIRILYFFAIFFSPNGGLIFFWGGSFIALFYLLKALGFTVNKISVYLSVILVVISALILSNWWTPFGWEAWGNRLILPSMISSLILLTACAEDKKNHVSCHNIENKNDIQKRHSKLIFFRSFILVPAFLSFWYTYISYSKHRYEYLNFSLWGSDTCKAMLALREHREMWPFKKSKTYLTCHFDRFKYFPGQKFDMSPLALINVGHKYDIRNGNAHGVLGKGWSHIESWGVWSGSHQVEIRFIPNKAFKSIVLEMHPLTAPSVSGQNVLVLHEGAVINDFYLTSKDLVKISLPGNYKYNADDVFKIVLNLPNAVRPMDVGINSDNRLLSVGLRSIEIIAN